MRTRQAKAQNCHIKYSSHHSFNQPKIKIMSTVDAAGVVTESKAEGMADKNVCANCGMPEVDDIKLEECTDCDVVKYCTDNCRENHREQHNKECKIRKALLHDRKLLSSLTPT